jgi:hypothetical protein
MVFQDPAGRLPEDKTVILAVTGEGTAFGDGRRGVRIREFTDGTSNTIMLVEADEDQAVIWTKPDDWKFDPSNPTKGLGKLRHTGFLAAFADTSADFIEIDTPPEVIKALMTRNGGEDMRMP